MAPSVDAVGGQISNGFCTQNQYQVICTDSTGFPLLWGPTLLLCLINSIKLLRRAKKVLTMLTGETVVLLWHQQSLPGFHLFELIRIQIRTKETVMLKCVHQPHQANCWQCNHTCPAQPVCELKEGTQRSHTAL